MQDILDEPTTESEHENQVNMDLESVTQDRNEQGLVLQLARILTLVGALSIAAIGLLSGGIGIVMGFIDPTIDTLTTITISVSFLTLSAVLGLALARHAWRSLQGRPSTPFHPPKVWPLMIVFVLVVAAGQTILWLDLLPAVSFPLFHVAAAILPSLIVLFLVGRSLPGVTRWRDVTLMLGSGAFLSTFLAFALEVIAVLGLLITTFISVGLQPGGQDLLQALATHLQDPTWLQDPADLTFLVRSPILLVVAFLVFAGLIPLIEESIKTVGVGLLAYRRPSLSQAFLWGLACGAGFALTEALLNTISGLDAWAPVILLRVGATLLHCSTGALMGLAWYAILAERRWGRAMGLYAASVGIHGLWNALAAAMTFISLAMMDNEPTDGILAISGLGILATLTMLVILATAMGLSLLGLTLYVRKRSPSPEASGIQTMLSPPATAPVDGGAGVGPDS